MRNILILTTFLIFIGIGFIIGLVFEQQKNNAKPKTPPQEIIQQALNLYQEKVRIPENVLIGIRGTDSTEAFLFQYEEPIKGLKYIGKFEIKQEEQQ